MNLTIRKILIILIISLFIIFIYVDNTPSEFKFFFIFTLLIVLGFTYPFINKFRTSKENISTTLRGQTIADENFINTAIENQENIYYEIDISEYIIGLLKVQLLLSGNSTGRANSAIELDNWSIGYVAGAVDFELYRRSIAPNDKKAATIMQLVFDDVMDESKLQKFLKIQLGPIVQSAMIKAGEDFSEFIGSDGQIEPSGWRSYISSKKG